MKVINKIQESVIGELDTFLFLGNIMNDLFEKRYYDRIYLRRYCESIKRRKTTVYDAITAFKDEALYWAMNNRKCEQSKKILELVNSKKRFDNEIQINKAREVEIDSILNYEGIKFFRNRAACPLCDSDNNTTLKFKGNRFYCFKCNEKGDGIAFIQKYRKITFVEAIKYLSIIN